MTDPVRRLFGANLKRERERAGLSQEELAFRSSLHRTEIGMLERGVRLPQIDTLVRLAGALECEKETLLEGIEWQPPLVRRHGEYSVDDG